MKQPTQRTPRSRAAQIFTNAMSGAGNRIASMAIGFFLTPFIVHELGLQNYGLWAVVGSLAGYLGLLDFGLGGAFVKFISEYVEQGRKDLARQVVTFGMVFYAGFGLLLAIPVLLLAPWIVHLFKMPASELHNAVLLFDLLFLNLVVSMVFGLPGATVVSMQRMDIASRNNFIGYVTNAILLVILLRTGHGIWGVVGAGAVQTVLTASLQYATARRLFGPLWHNPARFERALIGRMFGFGGWTQANSLLTIVSLDVGRFISASVVSVASVSFYELGSKLAFFSRSLPAYLLDAIMPAAAAANARGDDASVDRMYRSGTLYSMFATLAIAGFLIGASGPVMHVWMGEEYPYVSMVILWLAMGYAISGLTGVGVTILRACGMPRYETFYTGVSALTNIVCTALLAPHFGIVGVAFGTGIGWVAGTIYFTITYHRIRRTPWWSTVGSTMLRLAFACAVPTALLIAFVHVPFINALFAHRFTGLVVIGVAGVGYVLVYAALAWTLGAFAFEEHRLVARATALGERLWTRLHRAPRRAA